MSLFPDKMGKQFFHVRIAQNLEMKLRAQKRICTRSFLEMFTFQALPV